MPPILLVLFLRGKIVVDTMERKCEFHKNFENSY